MACLDFIIGPQLTYFNNCSVISWGGLTRINLIRSLRQPELERRFLTKLGGPGTGGHGRQQPRKGMIQPCIV